MRIVAIWVVAGSFSCVACGSADSGSALHGEPSGGGAPGGGSSATGGSSNGGAVGSSSSGGSAGKGASGGIGAGGAAVEPDAGTGGDVGAGGAGTGGGTGAGGSIPMPYCNGHSADLSTDMNNCGSCGTICQPTGIAYNLNAPGSIAVDSTSVYWAEHIASGRVFRVPLGSPNTATPPSIATGQKNPRSIVFDSTNVYWLTDDGVVKRPKSGGTASSIAGEPSGRPPGDLTLDGTNLYWTTHSDSPGNWAAVKKMPLGGGTAVEIATISETTDFTSIAVDATRVFFVHTEYPSFTSTRRYARIYAAPLTGGTPVLIHEISGFENIYELATDATYLYYSSFESVPTVESLSTAHITRIPLAGGSAEPFSAAFNYKPVGLALDPKGVFWGTIPPGTAGVAGGIRFDPIGIGTPVALSWNSRPTSITATDTALYFSDWLDNALSNGAVWRIGRCVASACQ